MAVAFFIVGSSSGGPRTVEDAYGNVATTGDYTVTLELSATPMDFELSDRCREFSERLTAFMTEHVYPAEAVFADDEAFFGQGFQRHLPPARKTMSRRCDQDGGMGREGLGGATGLGARPGRRARLGTRGLPACLGLVGAVLDRAG